MPVSMLGSRCGDGLAGTGGSTASTACVCQACSAARRAVQGCARRAAKAECEPMHPNRKAHRRPATFQRSSPHNPSGTGPSSAHSLQSIRIGMEKHHQLAVCTGQDGNDACCGSSLPIPAGQQGAGPVCTTACGGKRGKQMRSWVDSRHDAGHRPDHAGPHMCKQA